MLLIQILNMSLTASYCILAVLAVRLLLRRAPKKYAYLLWLVVAFRLCCPVSVNSPLSFFNLGFFDQGIVDGNTMAYLNEDVGIQKEPWLATGLSLFDWQSTENNPWNMDAGSSQGNVLEESQGRTEGLGIPLPAPKDDSYSITPLQVWGAVGTVLWLTGLGIMLLYGLISYLLLCRRLRKAVLLRENIYQSEQVCSPFVLGFLHPHIYIPFGLEERTLELVLAHERYHLKRRDHWTKLAAYLLLALHWFNPLCWAAFFLMGRDMEMSCDEHVLAEWERSCKPYCNALLSFATNRRSWGPSPLAFGESGAKGRIRNALNWKKPGTWVKVAAVGLCLLTVTACGLNPSSELSQQEEPFSTGMAEGPVEDMQAFGIGPEDTSAEMLQDSFSGGAGESHTSAAADQMEVMKASPDESGISTNNGIELIRATEETEGFLVKASNGKGRGIGWSTGILMSSGRREVDNLDLYGADKIQLEVSWECEELEALVEYYDVTETGYVLAEQRELTLPRENDAFSFDIINIFEKLPGNSREVRIYFSYNEQDCFVQGLIPRQGQSQRELEPLAEGTIQNFQGLIRSISDHSIVIDQKKQICEGDPEWETWAAQWDPNGYSDGLTVIDLAEEDLRALVSEDCRITILEDHWQPEREIGWEELLSYIEDCPRHMLWNFTVEGNQITEIEEQYLP